MSKALVKAVQLIKEECSKHKECRECFYGSIDEEGYDTCIIENYELSPSQWDLSELEKKE